jgi:hypothetical protein
MADATGILLKNRKDSGPILDEARTRAEMTQYAYISDHLSFEL